MDDELIPRAGIQKIGFEFQLPSRSFCQCGREETEPAPASFFGVIHRRIRVLQQRLGILSVVWKLRDANAGGNLKVVVFNLQRLGNRCQQLLCSAL
jgi:hypothetical protein